MCHRHRSNLSMLGPFCILAPISQWSHKTFVNMNPSTTSSFFHTDIFSTCDSRTIFMSVFSVTLFRFASCERLAPKRIFASICFAFHKIVDPSCNSPVDRFTFELHYDANWSDTADTGCRILSDETRTYGSGERKWVRSDRSNVAVFAVSWVGKCWPS